MNDSKKQYVIETENEIQRIDLERKTYYKEIFYGIMSVGIFYFLFSIIIFNGAPLGYVFSIDKTGTFMSFFDPLVHAIERSPELLSEATAMGAIIYKMFALAFGYNALETLSNDSAYTYVGTAVTRMYQQYLFFFMVYILVVTALILISLFVLKKGRILERWTFVILVLLSSPFLFLFEQGSLIILALTLVLVFFVTYNDSSNKFFKESGLFAFGLAAAIEPSLFIMMLFLFFEKRYKEFKKALLYGIILFILPYILMWSSYSALGLETVLPYQIGRTGFFNVSFSGFLSCLGNHTGIGLRDWLIQGFSIVIAACGFVAASFANAKWERLLLLTCIMIGIVEWAPVYNLVFLVVPLLFFLDSQEKRRLIDYFILLLLAAILVPKAWMGLFGEDLSAPANLDSLCIVLISLVLIVENIRNRILSRKLRAGEDQ